MKQGTRILVKSLTAVILMEVIHKYKTN